MFMSKGITALWAALALTAACAGVLGFRSSGRRPFEHRAHVLTGIACVTCHPGVAESRREDPLHLPDAQRCRGCHPTTHGEPRASQPCLQCHGMPYTASDLLQARMHLRFDHRRHSDPRLGMCVRCHAGVAFDETQLRPSMAVCLSCHQHRDQFKIRDCNGCHVDLAAELTRPRSHLVHDQDFMSEHGSRASSAADLCATCHRQSFCTSCHGATVPLLPARRDFDNPLAATVHAAGFRARHALAARAQPGLCGSCHAPSSCASCHALAGVSAGARDGATTSPSPHPPGWVGVTRNDHGPAARRDPAGCASCHGGAGEMLCVDCHQEGGIGGDPHPAGFRSHKSLSELPCRLCHRGMTP